jgi:hypothetical protein
MKYLRFLGNEFLLGTLIAVLSALTAVSSYQSSLAGGEQNNAEIKGMQSLNDGNAEYLTENQNISQDYNYYDNWYLNETDHPDIAEYYKANFSQQLQDAIARDPETVWDDQYYTEMAVTSTELFDKSEAYFKLGSDWNERGDLLGLVVMIMALGVAFAAWASLLKEESNLRIVFCIFAIAMLIYGLVTYLGVPTVAVAV